jgi:hypothetical protein
MLPKGVEPARVLPFFKKVNFLDKYIISKTLPTELETQ